MDKSKYIQKVKKLLALANSTNPHEAALAMQRAQKLMAEYSINSHDVELSEINEYMSKKIPTSANKAPTYMWLLLHSVELAFGCSGYRSFNYKTCRRVVVFYGVNERPQLAAYAFDVLTHQLMKARKLFLADQNKHIKKSTKITRADLFCEGWVNGVYQAINDFAMTEHEKNMLQQYKEQKLDLTNSVARSAKKCNGANNARYQGFLAGNQVKLNHAVSGASYTPTMLK